MFENIDLNHHSVCMSINNRRYEYLTKNFKAVYLTPPKMFRGVRWNRGSNMGCVLSHIAILSMARNINMPYCIVFEDDAYPRPDVVQLWNHTLRYEIPEDCGLLKLGSSSFRGKVKHINSYVDQMINGAAFGSHAYIIRSEMYDNVIDNMVRYNVPESFLNLENYYNQKYKPYHLNFDNMLFIQKNINMDNIISNKGGERYWFPNPEHKDEDDCCGCTSGAPYFPFMNRLIDDEDDYVEKLCVIIWSKFKRGKKTGVVNNSVIYTKDESGELNWINNKTAVIKWHNSNEKNYLDFLQELNNISYYKIY